MGKKVHSNKLTSDLSRNRSLPARSKAGRPPTGSRAALFFSARPATR